jgi:hypothetical protein
MQKANFGRTDGKSKIRKGEKITKVIWTSSQLEYLLI